MILEGFIQGTSDEELLKSLPTENISEGLVKAMNKAGLVQKEVQVKGKNGQTFTRKQWVKASDAQSTEPASQSKQAAKDKGDKGNSTKKPITFTGKSKDELWSNLKSAGYEVDGADKQTPQDKITLYKDKQEFTATFNKYNDGGVEVLNIKPVQTSTTVNKKPSQSYTNTGELLYNGQNISKVAKHGTYMYKVRGVKDLFGSQKQAKEYIDKNLLDHNAEVQNKPKSSMLEDYFTGNHGHSDSKSALVALLGKGYSRQDIMSQAEKSGVTWKKNDHEGINWMRASMAIQKAWKKKG